MKRHTAAQPPLRPVTAARSLRAAIPHHRLILVTRPPEELDLRFEGVKRHVPPPPGSIVLVPAGNPARVRTSGCPDALHIFLDPGLVTRVGAEAFGLAAPVRCAGIVAGERGAGDQLELVEDHQWQDDEAQGLAREQHIRHRDAADKALF